MTDIGIWQRSRAFAQRDRAPAAAVSGKRIRDRLWAVLHAPALLDGRVGGPGCGGLQIEDDRARHAQRR